MNIIVCLKQVPETTVILGHAGLDDLYEDAILACLRHRNIYLCCCSLSSGYIEEIIRRCPVDRLLFGSDGGFASGIVEAAIEKLTETGASEDTLQTIFYRNPLKLIPKKAGTM